MNQPAPATNTQTEDGFMKGERFCGRILGENQTVTQPRKKTPRTNPGTDLANERLSGRCTPPTKPTTNRPANRFSNISVVAALTQGIWSKLRGFARIQRSIFNSRGWC